MSKLAKGKILIISMLAVMLISTTAMAEPSTEKATEALTLKQATDMAIKNNPSILEKQKRWEEKKARASVAKAWPNPEFGIMKDDIPDTTLNPNKGMMTEYILSQEIMNPAKLRAMWKMALSDAEMAKEDYLDKQMDVYVDVKYAYYDLLYANKAVEIMTKNQELMGQLVALSQTNYASGLTPLQDTLRAQTEFSKMTTELLNMLSMASIAKAKVNAVLGRNIDTPLVVQEEFDIRHPDFVIANLQKKVQENKPSILSMGKGVEMAKNGITMAKKQQLPDFKVSVSYITTKGEKSVPMGGMGGSTTVPTKTNSWKMEFMIMLPLWHGQNKAEINAAVAGREAAEAALSNMRNMGDMDLLMAVSEMQTAWRQIKLYKDTIIPQAEQTYQAGIVGYTNGKVDFMAVLDSLATLGNVRLDYYKTRIDYEKALSGLEKAVGQPLIDGQTAFE